MISALFLGAAAAATGLSGVKSAVKAGKSTVQAKHINEEATAVVEEAGDRLDVQRTSCGKTLDNLGEEKLFILNHSISDFLDTFRTIKNVDFTETETFLELKDITIDEKTFEDLGEMKEFATSLASGAFAGTAGGALTAFGAYGAATMFASASTGTAISALSGAAATNATLAFFGGGSLAAGGLGIAGGTAVLGGLVAGPALFVMGKYAKHHASKKLDEAYINQAEASEIAAQLDTACFQCRAIRRRTYMLYNLLARLDSYFLPLVYQLEDVVNAEGNDYRTYSPESKKTVAAAAGMASTIKAVLDTPLLTEDGELTNESKVLLESSLKPKKVKVRVKRK